MRRAMSRPRPAPLLTSLVVKKASNARAATCGVSRLNEMPRFSWNWEARVAVEGADFRRLPRGHRHVVPELLRVRQAYPVRQLIPEAKELAVHQDPEDRFDCWAAAWPAGGHVRAVSAGGGVTLWAGRPRHSHRLPARGSPLRDVQEAASDAADRARSCGWPSGMIGESSHDASAPVDAVGSQFGSQRTDHLCGAYPGTTVLPGDRVPARTSRKALHHMRVIVCEQYIAIAIIVPKKSALTGLSAPRPRLERGTYCLGGTPVTSLGMARHGLTCRSAAARMAGRGLAWSCNCGHWLPVWLPGISLSELITSDRTRRSPDFLQP